MVFPLAAAITAGGSLLGGLFKSNSDKAATTATNNLNRAEFLEEREYQYNLLQENRKYDYNYNYEIADYNQKIAADAPRAAIASQLQGVMEGAKATGFNPLTLLGNTTSAGNAAFMGGSSGSAAASVARNVNQPPPLTSNELLTGSLSGIADELSGDAERRRVADTLRNDLTALQIDKLRSGVVAYTPSASASVGDSPSSLGRNTGEVLTPTFMTPSNPFKTEPITRSVLADPVLYREGKDGGVAVPEPRLDSGSGFFANGINIEPMPGFSSTQTIEDQYGDAASWIYGTGKMALDLGWTAGKWAAKRYPSRFQDNYKPKDK